jgi:hypothetical protein
VPYPLKQNSYVFVTWIGDHDPRHVHVYCNGALALKWDLENNRAIKGKATKKILKLIDELREEGRL